MFVVIYIDGVLVTGNHPKEINGLKEFFNSTFKIKDLGSLNYFLGIEILQEPVGVIMTQRKLVLALLKDFNCYNVVPTSCLWRLTSHLKLERVPQLLIRLATENWLVN